MFEKMMKHKKLLIGCGCALLAIILAVVLVVVFGNGAEDKPTLPSGGTQLTTVNGTVASKPDGTTAQNGTTVPNGTTKPVTVPSGTTAVPTVPSSVPTTPTTGTTEPTQPAPPVTVAPGVQDTTPPPTTPGTGNEVIPTQNPNDNYTQPVGGTHDFGDINAGNVRAADWNSWDAERQQAFIDQIDFESLTPEEHHNYILATWYNDYSCGMEGHSCGAQDYHDYLVEMMMRGCKYCGKSDCASFFGLDERLFTRYDEKLCPQYTEEKDPSLYCQDCGYKRLGKCNSGEMGCCRTSADVPCPYCKVTIHPGECHHCIKP